MSEDELNRAMREASTESDCGWCWGYGETSAQKVYGYEEDDGEMVPCPFCLLTGKVTLGEAPE